MSAPTIAVAAKAIRKPATSRHSRYTMATSAGASSAGLNSRTSVPVTWMTIASRIDDQPFTVVK